MESYEHHRARKESGENQGMRESAMTPEVTVTDTETNPITSKSGMTEQIAPVTHPRFGVPWR
jgi:hypothetical protein